MTQARLAIFDIDGTLTDTNAVDDACFVQAVAETLRLDPAAIDWSSAPHITDCALLSWLCQQHCSRAVREHEVTATLNCFHRLLTDRLRAEPDEFREIAGASTVLHDVQRAGWQVAIATGGWRLTAELKLRAIGIDPDDFVLATATDAFTRVEILELARAAAAARANVDFSQIVSIGDGVWDVTTAAQLGWPFIGIGRGERADRLRAAGASFILPDLTELAEAIKKNPPPGG